MSKLNVLVYFDGASLNTTGADNEEAETVASIKSKAAALRGQMGGRNVMLRDARGFDEIEHRVGVVGLLGGTSSDALVSVYEAYQKVGVPVASYDELLSGDGPELTDNEDPESPGSYLGRLKAAATERGLTFTDATSADEFEAMIKSFDDAKFQRLNDEMAEFENLTREANELGVAYQDDVTNEQLRIDVENARELKRQTEGRIDELRARAGELGIVIDDVETVEGLEGKIAAKEQESAEALAHLKSLRGRAEELGLSFDDEAAAVDLEAKITEKELELAAASEGGEEGEEEAFDVETADFEALKTRATELEIAFPSNIGEATLRKKVADHLAGTEE